MQAGEREIFQSGPLGLLKGNEISFAAGTLSDDCPWSVSVFFFGPMCAHVNVNVNMCTPISQNTKGACPIIRRFCSCRQKNSLQDL